MILLFKEYGRRPYYDILQYKIYTHCEILIYINNVKKG